MKSITEPEFQKLITAGELLEKDGHGPKVIRLAEHRYLKVFYQKNLISLARVRSRAAQFVSNAAKLKKRGITTVGILDTFRVASPRRDCVLYHGIPGNTVRAQLSSTPKDPTLSLALGQYIAQLHSAGVMFRSLHFGNIIQLDNGEFGLIDIADMRVNLFTLTNWQRRRNFQHIFRYKQDADNLCIDSFVRGYQEDIVQKPLPRLDELIERVSAAAI